MLYLTLIATFFIIHNYASYRDKKMIDPIISEVFGGFNQSQCDIFIFVRDEGRYKAKDTNAMYKQVNAFLRKSIFYKKAIPPFSSNGTIVCGNCMGFRLR